MDVNSQDTKAILPWGNPDYVKNPYPWYAAARENWPVYRDGDGTFVVTRYEDVVKFGKLASLSIVDPDWVPRGAWAALGSTVLGLDPPRHTQARRRGNKWFTPKLVRDWVAAAERIAHERLSGVADGETFDANMQLGVAPTHAAMCAALQFPADDFEPVIFSMHKTMAALSAVAGEAEDADAAHAFAYLLGRVRDMLAWKRANPGTGMADALIAAQDAGEMTEAEVLQTLTLFWSSGGHNPSYIIGSAIETFARDPALYHTFRSRPDLRGAFVTEIFRLYPPELSFARWTTEPLEIEGQAIAAGERVKFILDSANRDPAVFAEPDTLDLTRPAEAAMNLSFGMGPHQCAGQVISRAEVEVVLGVLADRIGRIELRGEPAMDNTDRSRAYVSLPVAMFADR